MLITNHPADRILANPRSIRTASTDELWAADLEFARRATALGQPGVVSRPHAAIRAELAAR